KNRLKAYKGSFRHFLASFALDRLEKEEYQIYKFKGNRSIDEIQPESVLSPGITPHNRKLAFSNYLVVIYRGEKEEPQYIKRKTLEGSTYSGLRRYEQRPPVTMEERRSYQTSFLKINAGDTIYFNIFGHMHNPYSVTYEGYWGWSERIAEWLPMDYTPAHMAKYAYGSYLSPKPDPIALLHKARSDALENNVSEATKSLYTGLKNLGNSPYADSLFSEIWDIVSADELSAYSKTADKGKFLLEFWQKTDVTPATQENERYVEHIQRLEYARQYYSSPQPRGYDDRGMIYVRYGPPGDWVKIPSHQFIRSNESWVYWIGSGLTFDFLERGGMYCLVSYLTEENINMVIRDPTITKPLGLIAFLEPRQSLHQKYARFYIALSIPESSIDYGSSEYLAETMREHGMIPHSLTQLAREGESIPLHMAHARFYRKDFTRLEIYYGFPCDLMADDTTSQRPPFVPLIVAIALRDSSYRLLSQETIRKSSRRITGSLYKVPYYAGQINKTLAPGSYVVNLEFQDPVTQRTTEKEMVIKIPGRSPNDLLLSDTQLATTIDSLPEIVTDPSFMKGDLWIIPHPFSFLSAVQPITLYFEIGNLLIDSSGFTSYSVTYTVNRERSGFIEKINPLWKKKTSLSSTYNRTGESRNEQEYFVLDMNTLNPGTYKLTVKVTDNTANRSQSSMKYFTLINQE
ncbi:MAG: GWxTD domain-containing protein, partial [Deltaproteobacteria bacterium]|nr:GWxTD domain-containing protein [Deltaproteobacteria bacterium]